MAEVSLANLLVCLSLQCCFLTNRKYVWNENKTRLLPNLACLAASACASLWNVVSWSTEKMFETKRRLDCSPILRALLPLPVSLFEMLLPDQQKKCTRSYKKKTRRFPQSCMPYCLEACASLWNAASWSRQAAWPETIFIAAKQLVHITIPKMFESKLFLLAKYNLHSGTFFTGCVSVQAKWFCPLI